MAEFRINLVFFRIFIHLFFLFIHTPSFYSRFFFSIHVLLFYQMKRIYGQITIDTSKIKRYKALVQSDHKTNNTNSTCKKQNQNKDSLFLDKSTNSSNKQQLFYDQLEDLFVYILYMVNKLWFLCSIVFIQKSNFKNTISRDLQRDHYCISVLNSLIISNMQ